MYEPKIAITQGDPCGIGAEIIAKALMDIPIFCRPVLIGCANSYRNVCTSRTMREWARRLGGKIPFIEPDDAPSLETWLKKSRSRSYEAAGLVTVEDLAQRGLAQAAYIWAAVEMALRGEVDAIVTGPITKAALHEAGVPHPGHTEMLAALTGAKTPVMMLAGPKLRVVPLTTHCALSEVPRLLKKDNIVDQMRVVHEALRDKFGIETPRLALCALNPHAGEGGMFGREEIEILSPAVEALRAEGINVDGPLPADTAFVKAVRGAYDAVAAPTHDQALIPVKLLHFDDCVNITLGLPIIRTSPGHGSALDIAGRGEASPAGMIAAIKAAVRMSLFARGSVDEDDD